MKIALCVYSDFLNHKELLLKEKIRSLWKQFLKDALKGKNLLPLGANSRGSKFFSLRKVPNLKRGQLKRITAHSSSLPLMCIALSVF